MARIRIEEKDHKQMISAIKTFKKAVNEEKSEMEEIPLISPQDLIQPRNGICEIKYFGISDSNLFHQGKILANLGFAKEYADYPAGNKSRRIADARLGRIL